MNYIEVEVRLNIIDIYSEVLKTLLADIGFESFVDTDNGFFAYCQDRLFDRQFMDSTINSFISNNDNVKVETKIKEIEQENWNATWEESYPAVLVDNYCYIRSTNHPKIDNVQYDILINPNMTFGTAHHPTTFQIIQLLKEEDLLGKSLMDMGTGTGILAILANKKGASYVEAIDIDSWAEENAKENAKLNHSDIIVRLGDERLLDKMYDVFIANINKNIILENMKTYCKHINRGGVFILSGFYIDDVSSIVKEAEKYGFILKKQLDKDSWAAIKLINVK
ncbi:MAG: 50S ribosomal protein L11 methyltransferase [Bacteroidales bacterium]|jgi:ribosomal protein L11 methyltransferase|nr:50S ribosomal protein L11 methyltransferase [Bacteroidales bacterium]